MTCWKRPKHPQEGAALPEPCGRVVRNPDNCISIEEFTKKKVRGLLRPCEAQAPPFSVYELSWSLISIQNIWGTAEQTSEQ
jgi:hypothetical protein